MKQLTKEQHKAISQWLKKVSSDDFNLAYEFNKEFEPACCDSCADGKACESEPQNNALTNEIRAAIEVDIYPERARALFSETYEETKAKVDELIKSKQTQVDRHPEETAGEYMDRVATINGRK